MSQAAGGWRGKVFELSGLLDRWESSPLDQQPGLERAIYGAYRQLGTRVRRREISKEQADALSRKYAAFNNALYRRR